MPASTELLLEQINSLQSQITAAERDGQPVEDLKARLRQLGEQFKQSTQALNESKVLKG